jgi:hypothetical protein
VNLSRFVLKELVPHLDATKSGNWFAVPACDSSGLPPSPGIPPAGNDTCIVGNPTHLSGQGAEWTLHVLGNPNDGSYAG